MKNSINKNTSILLRFCALFICMVLSVQVIKGQTKKVREPMWVLQDSCEKYIFIDQKKAIAFGEKSAELGIQNKNYLCQGGAYNLIGNAYHVEGNYTEAYKYYNKAMRVFEAHDLKQGMISAYVNLGVLCMDQQDYAKATKNFRIGIKQALVLKDSTNLSHLYNNLGVAYNKLGELDSSLICHFASLKIRRVRGNPSYIASSLSNLGVVYFEKKEYEKSMQYHLEALKMDSVNASTVVYSNLGSSYFQIKDYKKALYYFNKALSIGEENIERSVLVDLYTHLYKLHAAQNEFARAIEYADKALVLKDSLSAVETKKIVAEAAEKFETEKKELKIQNQAARLQKKNTQNIALAIGFVFVLVFLVFVYRGYKSKQKANTEILKQKHLVDEKNAELATKQKEIIDSITYAKRIQEAYLPPEKVFKDVFRDAFLLFMPKDLVSGDFYWFYTVRDENGNLTPVVYFAVADCTGHGVPGALMSMICCNALNEVVINQKTGDPGQILDQAREIIIQNMKSKAGSGQKDGMDIALCRLDRQSGQMLYAGANNPLWIIRKTGNVFEEVKPDKQPVGIFEKLDQFNTKTTQLYNGDRVYVFSDGYADQFGGPKGKKFKYSSFAQLLTDNVGLSMKEQGVMLAEKMEAWKGDLEQVDDVCVMGIQFNS